MDLRFQEVLRLSDKLFCGVQEPRADWEELRVVESLRAASFLPRGVALGHVERHIDPGVRQVSAPSFTGPRAGELVSDLKEHD